MKTASISRLFSFVCAATALVALTPVSAFARGHRTTVAGPRGTYQRQVTQTPGHYASSRAVSGANGRTATRSFDTRKTDTGRTTSAQATGFDGRSARYDSTRTRTDSGYTRQVNATGPNGGTAAKQVTVTKQDGSVTRSVITSTTAPKS